MTTGDAERVSGSLHRIFARETDMKAQAADAYDYPLGTGLAVMLAATMVFAPLFRAGQQPLALMGLQLAALALLVGALWCRPRISRGEALGVALLGLLPLFYLIPLPLEWAVTLPGRAPFADLWRSAFAAGTGGGLRVSLVPGDTESAWLVVLIPIGVFLAARALNARDLLRLVYVLLAVAAVESTLGLMQFGDGPDSPLYLGLEFTHFGSAVGTYTSRNHLAGLIEMALPLALALLFFTAGRGRDQRRTTRERAAFLVSARGQEWLVFAALVVLFLLALAFTRSRMGISLGMLALLLSVALFARRIGGDNVFGAVGTLAAVALGLAAVIGLVPVLDRFSAESPLDDQRWVVFDSTLAAIGSFFPLGSGPGTFAEAYAAFQPLELGRWLINRAHNDYLDWILEGGFFAAVLIAWLLGLYVLRWRRVWSPGQWSRLRFAQAGAGIGMLLILLHELVDYNLHIPANLVYFAVLAGIFFSDADAAADAPAQDTRPRTPRMGADEVTRPVAVRPVGPAPDQIKNPFLDD